MSEQYEPFSPRRVDEELEQLTAVGQTDTSSREQARLDPNTRLVHDLDKIYDPERKRYQRALQQVEDRLIAQRLMYNEPLAVSPAQNEIASKPSYLQKRRLHTMEKRKTSDSGLARFGRRVSLLVAALVMIVLVGSLVVVLNLTRQKTTTGAGHVIAQSTPIPTPAPISTPTLIPSPTQTSFGKTLYTTPSNTFGFNGLAWSPDSQRVASASVGGVQIWDATTGKHLVNVQLPGATVWPYGLAWSPNSQMIAVATNQNLLLVDGSTGAIVHTYSATTASVNTTVSSSSLSALFPSSGGTGFRAVTWSPDGRFIAAAVSAGANDFIQVINAQSVSLAYTLHVSGNYSPVNGLSWSSDGQYLAASGFNTEARGTVPPDQMSIIWAWKVSTRQIVFQHSGGNGIGEPLAFQPSSHNLAFVAVHTDLSTSLENWDVATGKLVIRYKVSGVGTVAWSPDGKYLAYVGLPDPSSNTVSILDANSGKLVYTYKGDHLNVCQLAWSPNGKYIVSGEGQTQGDTVAKVWTAG